MKTRTLIFLILSAVLLAGACGATQQETPAGSSGPGDTASVDPEQPVSSTPDPNATVPQGEGRAQRVRPRSGMADVHPVGWEKARQTPSGRSLRVAYWSGVEPCSVLDHVDVRYTKSNITVTLFEGHDPQQADVACIEIALLKAVVVPLEQPVDGRKIVDGAK